MTGMRLWYSPLIRRDDLTRGDTAKLAPGPRILFRRVDRK